MTAHVPGTPRRRGPQPRESDISLLSRPMATLKAEILVLLEPGPRMKWQLRQTLHEPDVAILKALKELQAERQVKVVGKVLDKRAWALYAWKAPANVPNPNARTAVTPKPAPPAESWWTKHAAPDADRQGFRDAASARLEQMTLSSRRPDHGRTS